MAEGALAPRLRPDLQGAYDPGARAGAETVMGEGSGSVGMEERLRWSPFSGSTVPSSGIARAMRAANSSW